MLKIPNNFTFNNICRNMLVEYLRNYIIWYYKDNNLYGQGFDIYLHNDYLRVIYKHHIYNISIITIKGLFYFYLKPYDKTYFTILATIPRTFNIVIDKIKEHHNKFYADKI